MWNGRCSRSRCRRPVQRLYHLKRQVLDQFGRIVARARNLSDLITTAIDANLTQVSLQQNEDMRRISVYVALAAVPTLIAGIYGMNFKELPELEWEFGYPAALRSCGERGGTTWRSRGWRTSR